MPAPDSERPPFIPDHELLLRIGRGSYGNVWLARNVLGGMRAVKVVRRDAFEHERPFNREFEGIKCYEPISRSHEGLVQILHVGLAPDQSYFYYSMELADDARGGGAGPEFLPLQYRPTTLATLLAGKGTLPPADGVEISVQLANALRHLHSQGLVHRDVKPSNIILVNGRTKLADIGLVAAPGGTRSMVGTEGYLAPEGGGSRQADIFSLGKVIYEMATGKDRNEFPNLPVAWLDHPERARLMEFNEIFVRACAREPARRYADAGELLGDLALLQGGRSVRRLRVIERRLKLTARATVAIGLLGCLAFGAFAFQRKQTVREREARVRIEKAEHAAREQLYNAELARARAEFHGGTLGRRSAALDAIRRAAAIRPSLELRNAAIDALSLPDLVPLADPASPDFPDASLLQLSADLGSMVVVRTNGGIEHLELPSGRRRGLAQGSSGWPLSGWRSGALRSDGRRFISLRHESSGLWAGDFADGRFARVAEFPRWMNWDLVPGTNVFLAGYRDRRIRWLDDRTWEEVGAFDVTVPPSAMLVSPDGRWLGSGEGTKLEISDLQSSRPIRVLSMPGRFVRFCWSPDSRLVATAHANSEIHLWHVESGQRVGFLRGHGNQVLAMAFLRDGRWLASSGWDGTLRLWDVFHERELARSSNSGEWLGYDPSTRRVALRRWFSKGIDWMEFLPPGQPSPITCMDDRGANHPRALAFHPRGDWLAVAGENGVPLFETNTGRELAHLDFPGRKVVRVLFSPDGAGLIASGPGGCLRWPVSIEPDGTIHLGLPETFATGDRLNDSVLGADGKTFAISHDGTSIHVRVPGGEVQRIPTDGFNLNLDISPDQRWLAAGSHHFGWARVWDLATGRLAHEFRCADGVSPRFTPDGQSLLTCSSEEIRLWNLETGHPGRKWARPSNTGLRGKADWSADGGLVAITRSRSRLDLLEGFSDNVLCSLVDGDSEIACLAMTRTGSHLAVGRDSGFMEVWDLAALRESLHELGLDWEAAVPNVPRPATPPGLRLRVVEAGR